MIKLSWLYFSSISLQDELTKEQIARKSIHCESHCEWINTIFLFAFHFSVLRNAFNAFDPEKNGYINTAMVGTILSMLGHQLDDATLAEIIAEVDEDGSGQIEFEEFTTLAARFLVEEDAEAMMAELKEAFRLYDKEGNGYITTGVLREILRELDDKLTNDDLDMMIEEIDSDGSGTVDFDGERLRRVRIWIYMYINIIFYLYRIHGSYDRRRWLGWRWWTAHGIK